MTYYSIDKYLDIYSEGGVPKDLVGTTPEKRLREVIEEAKAFPINIQAFTITFRNKFFLQHEYNPEEIKDYVFKYLVQNIYRGVYNEFFYVCEYGHNNRLHLHGIFVNDIKKTSQTKWFTLCGVLNNRFGRSEITQIKYPNSYIEYLQKEEQNKGFKGLTHMRVK